MSESESRRFEEAKAAFLSGLEAHKAGNLSQAETAYRKALALVPDRASVLSNLGALLIQTGRYEAAEEVLRNKLRVERDLDTLAALGDCLAARAKHADALDCYRSALAMGPDAADVQRRAGDVLLALGRSDEALECFAAALEKDPQNPGALLGRANLLFERGDLPGAEAAYEKLLHAQPAHLDALNNLGAVLGAQGRREEALARFAEALAVDPGNVEALTNRGATLGELGRDDDALAALDQALSVDPGFVAALGNRGSVLLKRGSYADALDCLDSVLAIAPGDLKARINRAHALCELGRYAEALEACDQVLAAQPGEATALCHQGNVLLALKRPDEALLSYDRALAADNDSAELLVNRCHALLALRRPEEALTTCEKILATHPGSAVAMRLRGAALLAMRRPREALDSYDRALAITPDDADALYGRCDALAVLDWPEERVRSYERLLAAKPDADYANGLLQNAKLYCCDWRDFDARVASIVDEVRAGRRADLPFSFLAISDWPGDQLRCARSFAAHECPPAPAPVWQGHRYAHDRIRVAYLSADFYSHATAFLMAGLFERHDRSRFEVTAISFGPAVEDDMTARLKPAFARFIDVRGKSDREVAVLLRELEIDIAVDLKGYTLDHRTGILSHRAAPIQVSYLGYPGTMGSEYIDYIIADPVVIPKEQQGFYAEKVAYLPHTYQVNDDHRRIAESTLTRELAGLPGQGVVFCCFNSHYKITPHVFDVWMRLLGKVPNSVLWLLQPNNTVMRNLRLEAERRGIAADRLIFAPRVRLDEHLGRHRLADIFLDTLPYNAHTTASDALWAGLPVVTQAGSTFAGRVAASLLTALGMTELVTSATRDYEALAFGLATDSARLAGVKKRLVRNRSTQPLFDTERFRRHIESAYVTMWERFKRGEPATGFEVLPIP